MDRCGLLRFGTVAATLAVLVFAASTSDVLAFEKQSTRFDDDTPWNAGNTVTIVYYNTCTEWSWELLSFIIPGFPVNTLLQLGVCFETSEEGGLLTETGIYQGFDLNVAVYGYPYEATVAVSAVDGNRCPVDPPLAIQP